MNLADLPTEAEVSELVVANMGALQHLGRTYGVELPPQAFIQLRIDAIIEAFDLFCPPEEGERTFGSAVAAIEQLGLAKGLHEMLAEVRKPKLVLPS